MNQFDNCGPSLTRADVATVEKRLGFELPEDLVKHYLKHNGGQPQKRYFDDAQGHEYGVHQFKPIMHKTSLPTIEDTYELVCVQKGLIPRERLPFAVNGGGDFFCIDRQTQEIFFHAMDDASQGNLAGRRVADSLPEFIERMQTEDDFYG
jgi:hypothetical protein